MHLTYSLLLMCAFLLLRHIVCIWSVEVSSIRIIMFAPREDTITGGLMKIAWIEPINRGGVAIDEYVLLMGTGDGLFVEVYKGPDKYYVQGGLLAKTKYQFKVAAINAVGQGPLSAVFEAETENAQQPGPMVAPFVQKTSTKGSIVEVRWLPPKDTGGRAVYKFGVYLWSDLTDATAQNDDQQPTWFVGGCNLGPVFGQSLSSNSPPVYGEGRIGIAQTVEDKADHEHNCSQ